MPKLVQPPPRVRLPWDALVLVFQQADPSTLAVLGRVSFDVLVSTAPLLYRGVEVKTVDALEALFCARTAPQTSTPSRINPLLTISHMNSFVLDLTAVSSDVFGRDYLLLSNARTLDLDLIPIHRLQIILKQEHAHYLQSIHSHLLPLFNPSFLEYDLGLRERTTTRSPYIDVGPDILDKYTRLEQITLKGIIPVSRGRNPRLACLPAPTAVGRPRMVRLHLRSIFASISFNLPFIIIFFTEGWVQVTTSAGAQDGSVILVVGSEEEKGVVQKAIKGLDGSAYDKLLSVEIE